MKTFKSLYTTLRKWLANKYISNGLYLIGFLAFYLLYINPEVDFNEVSSDGIQFENISLNEAFKKATKENKPIFIDVYATWCGPCKRMKKFTFTDTSLGEYYNNHFINISIDGESQEGRRFHKSYPYSVFPTVFIISPKGEILLKEEGFSFAFSLLKKATSINH